MNRTIDMSTPPALTLFPKTEEEEIIQSIYCLAATQKGTVPCYREYGVDTDWLHRPINQAQNAYAIALKLAIEKYLPKVKVRRVRFRADALRPDILNPILEVTILEQTAAGL